MTDAPTAEERRDLLCRTGQALYGYHWQSAVARYLAVEPRTVQRWVALDRIPPLSVLQQLIDLCPERIAEIETMREELVERLAR